MPLLTAHALRALSKWVEGFLDYLEDKQQL
jgi:hypothetical protein